MTEIIVAYVIVINFVLISASGILAMFFLLAGRKELFRAMAIERILIIVITLYSIFADQLLSQSVEWRFLIHPPYRPAIFRTPFVIGVILVLIAFWRWKVNGSRE